MKARPCSIYCLPPKGLLRKRTAVLFFFKDGSNLTQVSRLDDLLEADIVYACI